MPRRLSMMFCSRLTLRTSFKVVPARRTPLLLLNLDIFLQVTHSNKLFYLVIQDGALLRCMSHILVKQTMFIAINISRSRLLLRRRQDTQSFFEDPCPCCIERNILIKAWPFGWLLGVGIIPFPNRTRLFVSYVSESPESLPPA